MYKLCGGNEALITTALNTSSDLTSINNKVKVYPTITTDFLNVEFSGKIDKASYAIVSTTGELVIKGSLDCEHCLINVSDLVVGFYILSIQTYNQEHIRTRFIKN